MYYISKKSYSKRRLLLFSKREEIIKLNNKKSKKSLRRIFYNISYTEEEKIWFADFKTIIKSHSETQIPDYFDNYLLLAFIYANNSQLEKLYKKSVAYIKFSKEAFPMGINQIS